MIFRYEYEGLASNMTFASYVDPEELAAKRKIRRKDILAMLPPFGAVTTQVSLMVCYMLLIWVLLRSEHQ